MDYKSKITGIGPMALDFLEEKMIIIFNENAPAELAEISVLHKECLVERDIKSGDVVAFGDSSYIVTAVGEEANHTFKKMGHCTFKFTGKEEVELPGHIELSGDALPDIKVGDMIEVMFT